jgi:hypothetical protein
MRVTYLSPYSSFPVGGVRMFYIQAEILKQLGVSSYVHHPDKPEALCEWFDHSLPLLKDHVFKQSSDILIIPEMWALIFGAQCMESQMNYGMFVQNGYQIDHGFSFDKWEDPSQFEKLRQVYLNARIIMTISDDAEKWLKFLCPELDSSRIFRCLPYIHPGFSPGFKRKVITYMPRKLKRHGEILRFFLNQCLPADWSFLPIENMTDARVMEVMGESSIFLSFSEFEGMPAPPLEAACAGNMVVGYSGGGGDAYFEEPIFKLVTNGDIAEFIRTVLSAMEQVEAFAQSADAEQQRRQLVEKYGAAALRKNVADLAVALAGTF